MGIGVYNNLINDDDNGGSGMMVGFCGGGGCVRQSQLGIKFYINLYIVYTTLLLL